MNFNIAGKINVFLVLLSLLVLAGCSSNYQWGWYVILPNNKIGLSNIEFLIGGLGYTIVPVSYTHLTLPTTPYV